MKIAYYMPFKPLGHKNPSGDLIIGTELFQFLGSAGAEVVLASRFRCRWIYLKPHLWPLLFLELLRTLLFCLKEKPDIWLTYHSYYKAPDLIGPFCSRILGIPYTIFQGVYSTKRRRSWKTRPGFYLNRSALLHAACVFTNKNPDKKNLLRLLPESRVLYIPPGLAPDGFAFSTEARRRIRRQNNWAGRVVIMSAAMFRPGVKTEGLKEVIRACSLLKKKGREVLLMIAGDGVCRKELEELAAVELGDDGVFLGRLPREEMAVYYSAADIFAFPGIEESLGMVYLEAQSCRLPVVAYKDWGAAEAVVDNHTGLLAAFSEQNSFEQCLDRLISERGLREKLAKQAELHVAAKHDLQSNYRIVEKKLLLLGKGSMGF